MTEQQRNMIEEARIKWQALSTEEKENFYNSTGTIGYVESELPLEFIETLSIEEFEKIHDYICW